MPNTAICLRRVLTFVFAIASANPAFSATIQWTNTAGGLWNVPQNWSPNVVPTSPDTAVITNDGNYTVTLNASPTLSALTLGGQSGTQTLSLTFGSLNVTNGLTVAPAGNFSMGGGVLTAGGSGMLLQGSMTWSNGTLANATVLNVATNGTLTMPGSNTKMLSGTIHNHGTMLLSGTGSISGPPSAGVLYNHAGGLFELQTQAGFSGSRLVNDGLLRKSEGLASTVGATQFTNNSVFEVQGGAMMSTPGLTLGEGSSYLGVGTIRLNAGAINAKGDFFSESLVLDSPGFGGNGILHGSMIWSNGMCSALTVASNATLTLGGNAARTVVLGLTNFGTISWQGGGLSLGPAGTGAVLHNRAGALIDAQHPGNANISGGLLINDGVIRKSVGSGISSLGFARQMGVLDAQTGILSLGGVGGGMVTIGDGSGFIGTGSNCLGGNVTLLGSTYSENLVGGGIVGSSMVNLQGHGTLRGSAVFLIKLAIEASHSLTLASNSTLLLASDFSTAGNFTNAGTLKINPTGPTFISIVATSVWHNLANGVIELNGNRPITANGTPQLFNDGSFHKLSGTGTNVIDSALSFINHGTIMAQAGALMFSNNLSNASGTLALAGGKIMSATPLNLPGGRVVGFGTLQAPTIMSAATVEPGATNAVLVLAGNYTQDLAGSIQFDIGGTNPAVNYSQVVVTGDAYINGLIGVRFSPGYLPEAGESFSVLEAPTLTGKFVCHDGLLFLGDNRRLIPFYSQTNLMLNTVNMPDPVGPNLSIAKDGGRAVICWPMEFEGYDLYFKTNLSAGNWLPVSDSTNRHFEAPQGPEKYFRLISQP